MSKLSTIEIAALRIAAGPPLKRSRFSPSAYVSWDAIEELRKQLELHGIDWRRIHMLIRDEREQARLRNLKCE